MGVNALIEMGKLGKSLGDLLLIPPFQLGALLPGKGMGGGK